LDVDREVVVDEENRNLSAILARARLQAQHLFDDALIGSKTDRVSEETGDRAKLASVGTATPGLDWNEVELLPLDVEVPHDGAHKRGNSVELFEIERLPGNLRVLAEIRFSLLAEGINRCVNLLHLAACRVFDDLRPSLIGFAERHGVSMSNAAISSQCFVRKFRDVRTAHNHGNASRPESVCRPVSSRNHPGHRADSDQTNLLLFHELDQFGIAHRLCVAIEQQYLVLWRRPCLKQKHPEMRHEVSSDAVIRIVK